MALRARLRTRLAPLVRPVRALLHEVGGRVARSPYRCPVCEARVLRFVPFDRAVPSLVAEYAAAGFDLAAADFETLHREAYGCPLCRCADRDRLTYLYIAERWLPEAARRAPLSVLDIAPSPTLERRLRAAPGLAYRTADLLRPDVDDTGVDLEDMSRYRDGQFDRILCSHVLEHVPDDRRAMRELRRVLRAGGSAIVMVPLSLSLAATREDPSIADPMARTRLFAQSDHVRLYAKPDFLARLAEAGFEVEEIGASALTHGRPAHYGIAPRSVLYSCRRR